MASQQQAKHATTKQTSTENQDTVQDPKPQSEKKSSEELKADMDALLNEIDEVLEVNAEAMVASYIQAGGE